MGPYVENKNLRVPYCPSGASILTFGGTDGTLCRKHIFIFHTAPPGPPHSRMGVRMGPDVENTRLRVPYCPSGASILTFGGTDGTLCRRHIFIFHIDPPGSPYSRLGVRMGPYVANTRLRVPY